MLRILAPTDFLTDGYSATLVAVQLAKVLSAELIFVHAMLKPPVPSNAPEGFFQSLYIEEGRKTSDRVHDESKHLLNILGMRHGEVLAKAQLPLLVLPPKA